MAKNPIHTVKYRRKREGKTHYKKRLELLKSGLPRLVVRRTNTAFVLQLVEYKPQGDVIRVSFNSRQLSSFGWKYSKKSLPAAYLAGLALGKAAKEKGITQAILDIGLQTPRAGTRLFAALKGVVDAGVSIPSSDEAFPSSQRIKGEHIASMGDAQQQCSAYKKENLDVKNIPQVFEATKEKILS